MNRRFHLWVAFIIVLFGQGLLGQESLVCTIKGSIKSVKGEPLAYTNVFLEKTMEGVMSDEEGAFSFSSRAFGKHVLICSFIGYDRFTQEIVLKPGETLCLDIHLRESTVQTSPITIQASAFRTSDEEGVALTSMDVVRTPGAAADVFWAIKSFPGLQQVEEGAGLFVRGGDVSETAMYLDGALIQHPYKYESPTGGFFGTFSPFLLKGTFFSSGGFSSQYGNALSAVLAMESHDLPVRRQLSFGLGLAAESIYITLPLVNEKLGFSLSGNRSNTKMMFDLNQSRKEFSQYPFSFDFNLNGVYKINDQTQLKGFVFQSEDKVGAEVDDPDYSVHFNSDASNRFYNLQFKTLIEEKLLIQANAAYSSFKKDLSVGVMDLELDDGVGQFRVTGERTISAGTIVRMGMDYFRYRTLISGTVPQDELDVSPYAPAFQVNTDYLSHRAAQFVELDFIGPFGIRMIPGLRGEYESVSRTYQLDPRFSLVYPVSQYGTITAACGHYHQYPDPMYFDPYTGNPGLSQLKAVHTIVGYMYQRENTLFRLEAYYKTYDGLLLEDDELNYTNQGEGYARGVDLFLKHAMGPVSFRIAYSWLKARRRWMDLPVLASPYFDIPHNLTVVLNWDILYRLSIGLSFWHATGKPYTPGPGRYHESRVPDYQKLDLTVTYLHSFFAGNTMVFYVGASNILGRINIFDYRYSSDWQRREAVESTFGRSIYFGFSFTM